MERGELVKKVMKEKGFNMIQASKYIKDMQIYDHKPKKLKEEPKVLKEEPKERKEEPKKRGRKPNHIRYSEI